MKNRSNNTFTANCNEENIFLTATSPFNHSKMQPLQNPFASQKLDQIQFVRKNILDFIVEIRSSGNCPEISHMFNQILYSLDISYEGKKNINGIAQGIKQQKNLIKLTRLWNKLKYLKKDLQKLKTQKQSIQIPQKPQTCNIKFRLKPQKPATSSPFKTLPNQTKQTQQWKQKIKQQISYRQRINKIQSQSQKHEDNRHKILQKRLQKVKQMNKKVKDIYLKNKQKQRQKIHKHKYEVLFDPQTVELKKRGKTYNFQESKMGSQVDIQDINEDVLSEYQRKNQKKVTLKHDFYHKFQETRKKMDFHSKQEERYTKQDLITFKSLKQLINQSIKGSKSFKSIARENILNMTTKPSNNITKFSTPLNKSRSFENSKSISCKENKLEQNAIESKIMAVKEKKCQLQQERFAKIVTQAIQKEKRMLRIYQKKRLDSKTKKNSPQNQSHNSKIISHETSPTKTPFKKVFVTRKELLDKERRIFMNIQNKLQNKEYFLQQRVNRIRQRLRKQQQTRQKHQLNWQQYVSYTENVSVLQSMNTSLLKQATKLKEKQNQKGQQQVIKKAYMQKIKTIQKKGKQSKLAVLPLQKLQKKLSEIQLQELKTFSKVGGF